MEKANLNDPRDPHPCPPPQEGARAQTGERFYQNADRSQLDRIHTNCFGALLSALRRLHCLVEMALDWNTDQLVR